jgi:hypothetical protein
VKALLRNKTAALKVQKLNILFMINSYWLIELTLILTVSVDLTKWCVDRNKMKGKR